MPFRHAVVFAAAAALLTATSEAANARLRGGEWEPAPAPAPASRAPELIPAVRPGVVVRLTRSKDQLLADFRGLPIRYVPLMDEMLGKEYVVKEIDYGKLRNGVGLTSPDDSQGGTWYFPLASLTPWKETAAGIAPPVPEVGSKAVGMPTKAKSEIVPPSRNEKPWNFKISNSKLMNPVAPANNDHVDFEESKLTFVPWRKVGQVVSVECMEKLHQDPDYICDPHEYVGHQSVTPKPPNATSANIERFQAYEDEIEHLQSKISSLKRQMKNDEEEEKRKAKEKKTKRKQFKKPSKESTKNQAVRWQEKLFGPAETKKDAISSDGASKHKMVKWQVDLGPAKSKADSKSKDGASKQTQVRDVDASDATMSSAQEAAEKSD